MARNRPAKSHGIRFVNEDEREVFYTRESFAPVMLRGIPLLLVVAAAAAGAQLWQGSPQLTAIVAAAGVALTLLTRVVGLAKAASQKVVVSTRRVYLRTGIVDIADHYLSVNQISDMHVDPTILGRILGYADVSIQSVAGERDFDMRGMKGAYRLRDAILRVADELQGSQQQWQQQQWQQPARPADMGGRDRRRQRR